MGDLHHHGHIGFARQTQGLDNGGEFLIRQRESNEGFRQEGYLAEIQQNRLAILVDAKVGLVHVGLCEHQPLIGNTEGFLQVRTPATAREFSTPLWTRSHVSGWRMLEKIQARAHTVHIVL